MCGIWLLAVVPYGTGRGRICTTSTILITQYVNSTGQLLLVVPSRGYIYGEYACSIPLNYSM